MGATDCGSFSRGGNSRDLVTAYSEAFTKIWLSDQAEMEKEDEMQIDEAVTDVNDGENSDDVA